MCYLSRKPLPIAQVTYVKYLGLIVDDKLNWPGHIVNHKNKIVPMLGVLYRCSRYLKNYYLKLDVQ